MRQLEMNRSINPAVSRLPILIGGDLLVFLIFAWTGRSSHSMSLTDVPAGLLTATPFIIGWFLVAPWFGLFRDEVNQTGRKLVPRLLLAWSIGGPLALVLRALFLGRSIPEGIFPTFAIVSLSFTTFFLLAWRLGYIWWMHHHHHQNQNKDV